MHKNSFFMQRAKLKDIKINTEFIKLDSFLKWAGIASLGSEAKMYISEELVKVNGVVCTQRGKKVKVNDIINFNGDDYRII